MFCFGVIGINSETCSTYWDHTVEIENTVHYRHYAGFGTDLSLSIIDILHYDQEGKSCSLKVTFLNIRDINHF